MKRFIIAAAALLTALTASAQVYVGGQVSFANDSDNDQTSFSILPEVGYTFNEHWAVGGVIGFAYDKQDNANLKTTAFEIAPYARYTYASFGPVSLFADGGVGIAFAKLKNTQTDNSEDYTPFEVGIKPGLALRASDNLSFVAHVGFFGYRDNDDLSSFDNGLDLHLNGNDISFGVYYNF